MTLRWKIAQWFELRWWRNYLHGKDKDIYLQWKRNYWGNVLSKVSEQVKIEPSKTIVDLGCGPAGIFIALPENKITAVDPLLNEYQTQTSFFRKSDYPNTTFVTSTIEEFSNPAKYDLVFCMNAINHVHDIQKGFEKLRELCGENGAIVVSIDAHNFSFFKYLFRLVPGDILHPHQYDLSEYKNMLAKDAWEIAETVLLKHEFFFDHYLLLAKRK